MELFRGENYIKTVEDVKFIRIKESKVVLPFFSIVIPTYKRANELREAIESAINQRYSKPYEIVVVDNNPERNDETERMVSNLEYDNLAYYKNERNVGMYYNWNRCLIAGKGQWVVFCHDDDKLIDTCLLCIQKEVNNNPKCKAIMSRFEQFFQTDILESRLQSNKNRKKKIIAIVLKRIIPHGYPIAANLFCDNVFGPPTCGMAVNKNTMIGFGGWDTRGGDWSTMISFSGKYTIKKCSYVIGKYRWGINESLNEETIRKGSRLRNEILHELVRNSLKCRLFYCLLKNDFKKKEESMLTDSDIQYSFPYRLFLNYYSLRVG